MARPYSTPRERVWDMVIKQLVAPVLNLSCKSSHDVSDGNYQSKTCDFFCTCKFDFYCVPAHDSTHLLLSALLTYLRNSLSTQTEILNFLVNQVSCDWILCCDWYTLHGAWWWTTIWPCPRPYPSVRPRKANIYQHLTHMVVQVLGISAEVMIGAQLDWYALP